MVENGGCSISVMALGKIRGLVGGGFGIGEGGGKVWLGCIMFYLFIIFLRKWILVILHAF